jgi:hypothetical protein
MNVHLLFSGEVDEHDVLPLVAKPDSGFDINTNAPLLSGAEFAVAVAGVVLSAAQLVVSLVPLFQSQPERRIRVRIRFEDGATVDVNSGDAAAIDEALRNHGNRRSS